MFFNFFKPKVLTDEEKMIVGTAEYSDAHINPRLSQEEINNLKETKLNENQKACLNFLRAARKYLQEKYPGTEFTFTHCEEHWDWVGNPYDYIFTFNENGDEDNYTLIISEEECSDSFISKKINEKAKGALKRAFDEANINLVGIYFGQQFGRKDEYGEDTPEGITNIFIKGKMSEAPQIAEKANRIAKNIYPRLRGYIDISYKFNSEMNLKAFSDIPYTERFIKDIG